MTRTGGPQDFQLNTDDGTISQIDPRTNAVVDTFETTYDPYNLVYGQGFLWVGVADRSFS